MKNFSYTLLFLLFSLSIHASDVHLVDKQATERTKALYRNLMMVQRQGKVLFGHQDATMYGRTWSLEENRSDIKDVTGTHPAVVGLDFEKVTTLDSVKFRLSKDLLVKSVKDTYNRGSVSTFAWHAANPANDGSFYWEKAPIKVVSDILQGGKLHEKYKDYLKSIATVASDFVDEKGELIPVIFRPFHEYDGDWFWWGKGHCTKEEFIQLWQFTVDYLKTDLGVHHFIYAFSPDCKFSTEEEFLDYYPGDEYVDMLGMDDYWDFRPDGANNPELAKVKLKIVSEVARKRNKLAAFTETGLEGITVPDWFTQTLLPILKEINICYVLIWRNATDIPHHYYIPTIGHPAAEDFKKFCSDKIILMEKDLPDMYK